MSEPRSSLPASDTTVDPPPRAFTQGVGIVFQFTGVVLFLLMMSICFLSSLLGKETASREDLNRIGWHFSNDPQALPNYSYPRATTLSVSLGVFFGMALAGVGLGLQAERRAAPWLGVLLTGFATVFWLVQLAFAIHPMHSIVFSLAALVLMVLFGVLLVLAIGALKEMVKTPPPRDHEILPADYKVPYSHMHQDPPEVRLAHELHLRRERLAVQQKELEMLEEKIRRKH